MERSRTKLEGLMTGDFRLTVDQIQFTLKPHHFKKLAEQVLDKLQVLVLKEQAAKAAKEAGDL